MVQTFKALTSRARDWEDEAIDLLREFVSHHTVAPRDDDGLKACAESMRSAFKERGYIAATYAKGGAPVVYASKDVGAKKTLLFYHHYDVQPEGSLDLWHSSPWELVRRGDRFYGRGTNDDKGPLVSSMMGVEMIEQILGRLPVNVRFVVEGEEEAGSVSLPNFANEMEEFLVADGCVWEGVWAIPGSPGEVVCGLKGDAYFDLIATGTPHFARTDAHSGDAAAVPNAAWRLVWALSTLKATDETITLDGFNDFVRKPPEEDLEALRQYQGDVTARVMHEYGLEKPLMDRRGLELLKELFLMPQMSICGITTGYQGAEDMTIVPAAASAKLDVRIVPDLTVDKVHELLRKHLDARGFSDIKVVRKPGYEPAKTSVRHPYITLVHSIMKEACDPAGTGVVPMAQGSGPAFLFAKHAPLCMAYSYADLEGTDCHAPNENMKLESLPGSMAVVAAIAERLADAD
jgi:acetylornithine deacetylase/succinyl-diaminopimelate desuccinylase-like protein